MRISPPEHGIRTLSRNAAIILLKNETMLKDQTNVLKTKSLVVPESAICTTVRKLQAYVNTQICQSHTSVWQMDARPNSALLNLFQFIYPFVMDT
jgi:hypothetical protein